MDRDLRRRARQVLADASVLAEVSAGRMEWQTPSAGDRPARPSGNAASLHDAIARRFAGCRTERDLRSAVEWAQAAVQDARKAKPRPVIPFKHRILTEWEGHHDQAVARATTTPRSTVRRWREEDGRDPLYGRRTEAAFR